MTEPDDFWYVVDLMDPLLSLVGRVAEFRLSDIDQHISQCLS